MEKTILRENNKQKSYSIITGVVAGFVNGLFGGGGGMIVVPLLIWLLNFQEQKAHATAILIILPLSILSGLLYASFGNVKMNVLLPSGIGVIVGGIVGAFFLKKISAKWVTIIFSVAMLAAGVRMALM